VISIAEQFCHQGTEGATGAVAGSKRGAGSFILLGDFHCWTVLSPRNGRSNRSSSGEQERSRQFHTFRGFPLLNSYVAKERGRSNGSSSWEQERSRNFANLKFITK